MVGEHWHGQGFAQENSDGRLRCVDLGRIMNGFYVDVDGLNGLYNQLVRASQDASDTLRYTKQHCDLGAVSVGLLMIPMGPHRKAYQNLTTALTKLSELTQNAGIQIKAAQGYYARADQSSAAKLDAAYPGATDPAYAGAMLADGRSDLQPPRSTFADITEPTSHLTNPEYTVGIHMWSINPMTDLISPAAWLRQVSIWLFDRDPFEGWASQFSGDWRAYTHCAVAMGHIGGATKGIGMNLLAGARDVDTVWRGKAAEAEQEFQLALGLAAARLDESCAQYHKLYLQAAEAVKNLFDVVSEMIADLLDLLIIINAAAAAGTALISTGIGAFAGYGIAAYYTWQAVDLYNDISKLYENTENLVRAVSGSVDAIQAEFAVKELPAMQPYRHPANS
jgi:hypothetical protein